MKASAMSGVTLKFVLTAVLIVCIVDPSKLLTKTSLYFVLFFTLCMHGFVLLSLRRAIAMWIKAKRLRSRVY